MKFHVFALIFLSSALLIAQGARADEFTVSQLFERALANNPELAVTQLEVQSARLDREKASRWPNPTLDFGLEKKDESGGQTNSYRIGLSQELSPSGRYSAWAEVRDSEMELSRLRATSSRLDFAREFARRLYSFLAAREIALHAEERLERFRSIQTFLSSRTFASPQKKAEATIVGGRLVVLGRETTGLSLKRDTLWADLNLYLKMPTVPNVKVSWFTKARPVSSDELLKSAQAQNVDIQERNAAMLRAEKLLEFSKREAWPPLTVSGTYSNGSGFAPEKIVGIGLSMPIPLLDANQSAIQAQRIRLESESMKVEFEKRRVETALRIALLRYEAATQGLNVASIAKLDRFEKEMRDIDRGFRKGQIDLLTYLEADSQHAETVDVTFRTQVEFVESEAELATLIGETPRGLEGAR